MRWRWLPALRADRRRGCRVVAEASRHNRAMSRPNRSSRHVLWGLALALLFKSAVPLLAAQAAALRGVSVADVCAIYGVAVPVPLEHRHVPRDATSRSGMPGVSGMSAMPDMPGMADSAPHHDHGPHDGSAHGGDHCALSALAAFAPPAALPLALGSSDRIALSPGRSAALHAGRGRGCGMGGKALPRAAAPGLKNARHFRAELPRSTCGSERRHPVLGGRVVRARMARHGMGRRLRNAPFCEISPCNESICFASSPPASARWPPASRPPALPAAARSTPTGPRKASSLAAA